MDSLCDLSVRSRKADRECALWQNAVSSIDATHNNEPAVSGLTNWTRTNILDLG